MVTALIQKDNSFNLTIENPSPEEQVLLNQLIAMFRQQHATDPSVNKALMFAGFRSVQAQQVDAANNHVSSAEDFLTDMEDMFDDSNDWESIASAIDSI